MSSSAASRGLFRALNHISRECRSPERMAEFYCRVLGFERIEAPPFEFSVCWIRHPSGLTMHLIEGEESFRLMEGPTRNAETGERAQRHFTHGLLDPIHLRRGHHIAFDISDLEALKAVLDKEGVPYGTNHIPGSTTAQIWFHDCEGNGIEGVYRQPTST